jgi:hypothetical protein
MAKADSIALNKLKEILDNGGLFQIRPTKEGYELTVWPIAHVQLNHHHYEGNTLIESKINTRGYVVSTGFNFNRSDTGKR